MKPDTHPLTITLYNNETVLFQGKNDKRIKEYILNKLEVGCFPIYENESRHIIRRVDKEPILGYEYQFCAAFFHTHEWWVGNREREHQCLDERRCIISKRAVHERSFRVQPKTVVAVVKFENEKQVVYEAKYTNCLFEQMHAEDFFKEDVEKEELKTKISENPNGIITMYLTLPPCNESVSIEGTEGTSANKSCCNTLKNMYDKTLKDKIELHIKVTHPYRLSTSEAEGDKKTLRKNAVEGIKDLMDAGIEVSAMDREDWGYLFSMTIQQPRDELDHEIRSVLHEIATTDKETLLNPDMH